MTKTKRCYLCKIVKNSDLFHKNKRSKDGLQSKCKECNIKKRLEYYQENKEDHRKYHKNRQKEISKKVFEIKQKSSCTDCGESDPIVLEFDHTRDKKQNISNMVGKACSIQRIKKEIEKCEIVCANCHRKRTAKRGDWHKHILQNKQD